jgi:hypothetical protein
MGILHFMNFGNYPNAWEFETIDNIQAYGMFYIDLIIMSFTEHTHFMLISRHVWHTDHDLLPVLSVILVIFQLLSSPRMMNSASILVLQLVEHLVFDWRTCFESVMYINIFWYFEEQKVVKSRRTKRPLRQIQCNKY